MKTRRLLLGIPLVIAACESASSNANVSPADPPPPLSSQPLFDPLVTQAEPPPPISGGTLAIDGETGVAVAADADRDRVYVVDLPARAVRHDIALGKRSEPGRVALDRSGRAHVALRGTAELATIDLMTGSVALRPACTAPRGVVFDQRNDTVLVACATGDVVTFPVTAGAPTARTSYGRDLRDVMILRGQPVLTRFRSAHVVVPQSANTSDVELSPNANLAWRAVTPPAEDSAETPFAVLVSQVTAAEPVKPAPGGYGGSSLGDGCTGMGIVSTSLWAIAPPSAGASSQGIVRGTVSLPKAVLPVDVTTNGREFVVVATGNAFTRDLAQLFTVHRSQFWGTERCPQAVEGNVTGQAIAAAFDDKDLLVVQTREPATLQIMTEDRRRTWKTITLSNDSRADTGHAIFHANAGNNLACASCHAEGADDGHTWEFVGQGQRRTPSLLGTTRQTEPFHWSGDMRDLGDLMTHVFVERMGGPKLEAEQVGTLGHYLFALPPPPKLRSVTEIPARGQALFNQRCSSCHSGEHLTNNHTVDVGTGGLFQVPSLVGVSWRAPFLHTGCAATLFDCFDPACGGAKHGDTAGLSRDQIADVIAYLETL